MVKKFSKVFYILQTRPKLRVCGYAFNKREARYVADEIQIVTGKKGRIVEFTRNELEDLGYERRN